MVATRGNMVTNQRLAEVTVGASTKNDVATLLGSPTTVSTFNPDVWYYIGQRTEQVAFFAPEVKERRVLQIAFDPSGVVRSIDEMGLADGRTVALVDRETPTMGRQMTFMEQILGNVGRYTNARTGSAIPAGRI